MDTALRADIEQLQAAGLYRSRRVVDSSLRPEVMADGRRVLQFCSNDYLGLASSTQLAYAVQGTVQRYGVGAGASHLVCGHTRIHHALEEEIAAFVGRPRALVFSTGYMANLGVITALLSREDAVYEDRLNHASLIDGGLASGARFHRYRHAEPAALAALLERRDYRRRLVVSDGVFSMDGDIAPLSELAACATQHGAWLMVDDAHGIGVFGPEGRGSVAAAGLSIDQVPILMGTFGKAFGTAGAYVAGSETLIDYLIQKARTYIYTTAMPSSIAEATRTSIKLVQREDWRRERLQALITRFRAGAAQLGLPLLPSQSPIQPLLIGDTGKAVAVADALWHEGILITAIRPPTVPAGSARLRITFTCSHTEWHVDRLLSVLAQILRQHGILV